MSWRELWSIQGKKKKFWKIRLSGKSLTEHCGLVGSAGEEQTQDFPTREEAQAAYEKLIRQKQLKAWFDKPDPNDIRTNLLLAVATADLPWLQKCLQKDPEAVHHRYEGPEGSEQPLHLAVREGHRKVVRCLLDAGADINARGADGQVPVLIALIDETPDFEMVALLLEYQPDLTIADEFGMTPLHLGTLQEEIAEFLQKNGVALDPDPAARLLVALRTKGLKEVEKQIQANPAVARSPRIGDLVEAVMGGGKRNCRIIKLLLENGLDANGTGHGCSLLQTAIFRDAPDLVQALLEHGADPNRKDSHGDPFLIAAWRLGFKNRKAICELLIRHGARKDLTADLFLEGVKPVLAKLRENPKLLEDVADPVDLLNRVIAKGSPELVELLLSQGVDPNAHGRTKAAPLRCAVGFGRLPIVQLLLEHGADPNPQDVDTIENGAPLCYAANYRVLSFKNGAKLQDLLLAHGMKPMEP